MKITLNYQEIKEALKTAIEEKTKNMFPEQHVDDHYFEGINDDIDFSDIRFSVDIEAQQ